MSKLTFQMGCCVVIFFVVVNDAFSQEMSYQWRIDAKQRKVFCMDLKQDDKIIFSFNASEHIDFWFALKQQDKSLMVIGKQRLKKYSKTSFFAKDKGHYCFQWENPHDYPVNIHFSIQ